MTEKSVFLSGGKIGGIVILERFDTGGLWSWHESSTRVKWKCSWIKEKMVKKVNTLRAHSKKNGKSEYTQGTLKKEF